MEQKIYDEKAVSMAELSEAMSVGLTTAKRIIDEKLANGEWEQVYKKGIRGPVKAYRLKR